jgi:hypothetical protein
VGLDVVLPEVAAVWGVEDDAVLVALTEAAIAEFDQVPLDLSSLPVEL